jgi:outer membrane protein
MIERYKALDEELKTKKFVLSDEALYQKQLDLAEMRNEIQSKMHEIEGQLQVDQKRLEGPLLAKLKDIIEELGKSQGFALILHRNAPGVLYAREGIDITSQVIERYNKKKG